MVIKDITPIIMVMPMTIRTILEVMTISNTKDIKIRDPEDMVAIMEVTEVAIQAVVVMAMVVTVTTATTMAATTTVTEVIVEASKVT
ncbi:hypothetical protein BGW37DRAFT_118191 [Umbelopsis sp. PMI_123]|nr:hypothetical protein BGW37DRAFT_118191 [Umbelopsis sp. PMI_123]